MRAAPVLAAAALLLPLPALAQDEETGGPFVPPATTEVEAGALFEWFDSFGVADAWKRPFILLTSGKDGKPWADSWSPAEGEGFLLENGEKRFRVLTVGLADEAWEKVVPGEKPDPDGAPRLGFVPADLEARARWAQREALADAEANRTTVPGPHISGVWVSKSARLLVLARACWARGMRARALEMIDAVRVHPLHSGVPLRRIFEADLARIHAGRLALSFADPRLSRPALLERAQQLRKALGAAAGEHGMEDIAEMLRRMVEEDATHRPPAGFPESCPPEEAAREWVWRLRDQGGFQFDQPGYCDLSQAEGEAGEPARRLLAMGVGAVPALLDVLEDARFTRGASESFGAPHPHTVGSAAHQLLWRISGRVFRDRADAEAWWAMVRQRGYDAVLEEDARAASPLGGELARLFVRRRGAAAVPLVAEALRRADRYGRSELIWVLSEIPGEGATAALAREAREGPGPEVRASAGWALRRRGDPIPLEGFLGAFREADPADLERWGLVRFLAETREAAAVEALRARFHALSPEVRIDVLLEMEPGGEPATAGVPVAEEYRSTLGRLLREALEDTAEAENLGHWEEVRGLGERVRVCDVAAGILSRVRGDTVPFDVRATTAARDRALAHLRRAQRGEAGSGPELARPGGKRTLIDFLVAPVSEEEGARGFSLARDRGLGALPVVEDALAALPPGSPRREALADVARELAWTVGEVTLDGSGVPATKWIQQVLAMCRGRVLRPPVLVEAIALILEDLPEEADGVEARVARPGDGSGCSIRVTLPRREEGTPPPSGKGWVVETWGGDLEPCVLPVKPDREDWDHVLRDLAETLESRPGDVVERTIVFRRR